MMRTFRFDTQLQAAQDAAAQAGPKGERIARVIPAVIPGIALDRFIIPAGDVE